MDYTECAPGRLCRRWRVCTRCARIRQAQFAALADARATGPYLTWACVDFDPNTKSRVLRSAALAGTGGLWTIEHGTRAGGRGLHLNLLIDLPGAPPPDAGQLARAAAGVDVWARPVPRADVRNVAAYISKRTQHPHPDIYGGRIAGTWGHWRGVIECAAADADSPASQAAAVQIIGQRAGLIPGAPPAVVPPPPTKPREIYSFAPDAGKPPELTRDEYREIAARHLGPLLAMLGKKL